MSETPTAEKDADVWASLDPAAHCFRENNCIFHTDRTGFRCCCCGYPPEAHEGCDCD